jgi:phytoene dehydrogenase-like protein
MQPLQTTDALIVGGGMAGLTAAAYLSRAGLTVLLCEKGTKTGGLVNSFEYKGFVFDGGIRAIENSGIIVPMLRQLGISLDFLPSTVSIGIGNDVIEVSSKDSLRAYQDLLGKHFPENKADIASIVREIEQIMGYMDVLYGIDNPLFLDLKNDPPYVFKTILPWMLKYAMTMPKIAKLNQPVDEYLSRFSSNQALIDIIAQHFFQKTPTFFALSYFSLYLDYRYPKGGTGALPQALERFFLEHGGAIRTETEITRVDPGTNQAVDANGNAYRYKKLVWAADLKTLYRILDLGSLTDAGAVRGIRARQQAMSDKIGGDSIFTVYLTLNLDKTYFQRIASAHLFYTPSLSGLAHASLQDLVDRDASDSAGFTMDQGRIVAWLERFLDLTTYEISCPVLRDDTLAPEGQTGLIISTLFDYSLTKHIQAMGWYEEFRQLMADRIIQVLNATIYPGLAAAMIDRFTSTPLTLENWTGNSEGAITGWAFTNDDIPAVSKLTQVARSVLTPIPNTYQAGQWTYSPSGLPISILTGKLAADRVLKDLA